MQFFTAVSERDRYGIVPGAILPITFAPNGRAYLSNANVREEPGVALSNALLGSPDTKLISTVTSKEGWSETVHRLLINSASLRRYTHLLNERVLVPYEPHSVQGGAALYFPGEKFFVEKISALEGSEQTIDTLRGAVQTPPDCVLAHNVVVVQDGQTLHVHKRVVGGSHSVWPNSKTTWTWMGAAFNLEKCGHDQ